jgi:hypothetical protein
MRLDKFSKFSLFHNPTKSQVKVRSGKWNGTSWNAELDKFLKCGREIKFKSIFTSRKDNASSNKFLPLASATRKDIATQQHP